MARCAVDIVGGLYFEVCGVRELDLGILSGRDLFCLEPAAFGEAGIFDFLGRMAAAAAGGGHGRVELRREPLFGMANGALLMGGEGTKRSPGLELMASGAVRPKSCPGVDTSLWIHMLCVREIEEHGARRLISRKRKQVRGAGWKSSVALRADYLFDVLVEVGVMATHTLIVAWPLQHDGAFFHWHMAESAVELAAEFVLVKGMQQELRLLRPSAGRGGNARFARVLRKRQ